MQVFFCLKSLGEGKYLPKLVKDQSILTKFGDTYLFQAISITGNSRGTHITACRRTILFRIRRKNPVVFISGFKRVLRSRI